jgi:diguanylate cyclase (GGDEF)-like protein/putative nucleotidyltransferase with HDIG domain/PAS domain S-box-containing protein
MAIRMSLGLTSLAVSVLCLLHSSGVMPDSTEAIVRGRSALCEALAISCSSAAGRNDSAMIAATTRAIVQRNTDILYAAVHRDNGQVLVEEAKPGAQPLPAMIEAQVPIYQGDQKWGTVLVRFKPLSVFRGLPVAGNPSFRFIALCTLGLFISDVLYLYLVFKRERSRSGGIPERVRATLDTLVEGVLLMDLDRRIALVNESFARTVGKPASELEGRKAGELSWSNSEGQETKDDLPWASAIKRRSPELGSIVALKTAANGLRTLSVNSTPIVADNGSCHGVLATFDDMTGIERKNLQLRRLLEKLRHSRDEIRSQNQKLQDLAALDPLTSCLNRRAFFERAEPALRIAERHGQMLSCIMLDIDHFKSVNDRHGHAVGDLAIQMVSGVLRSTARAGDLVCRYGGEEFCVLLPLTGYDGAVILAERIRTTVMTTTFAGISVTSSFGVVTLTEEIKDAHDLLNRADQALYAAKRSGRNRVIRFDEIPDDLPAPEPKPAQSPKAASADSSIPIPYHAVTSLIAALAHRDPATAEHSLRVANLCVLAAKGLISERECYVLEIAALLHDVGKLGIPDAILKKPAALTETERRVMKSHDDMGVEIITAAFSSDLLCNIIRTHHARYRGNPRSPELPKGEDIPLGARILTIADSYDAIVSDRVYRKGRSRAEAFAELRRCAGEQFDPDLVEHFIKVVSAHEEGHHAPIAPPSKGEALKIGLLIEKFADALDAKDLNALHGMADRLGSTARECRIPAMTDVCTQLAELIATKGDWMEVLELTNDLLDLCRSTQATYLAACPIEENQSAVLV